MTNRSVNMTKVRSKELVARDPLRKVCKIVVRWRPLVLEGVEPDADNIGLSPVLRAERCPARLEIDPATKHLRLVRDLVSTAGEIESIDTACRVPLGATLKGGEFSVQVIRDDASAISELARS